MLGLAGTDTFFKSFFLPVVFIDAVSLGQFALSKSLNSGFHPCYCSLVCRLWRPMHTVADGTGLQVSVE